jgi:hypothetical protein
MSTLIYQKIPVVTFATNKFIDVPVILQYHDTPMISVVREEALGYTTEIPIYHSDGTYLAKVRGTRIWATEDGKKAGLVLSQPAGMTVCKLGNDVLFEIYHEPGDAFRTNAELHTPDGYFVKSSDALPQVISNSGQPLQLGGIVMEGNTFVGGRIGIWIKADNSIAVGVG